MRDDQRGAVGGQLGERVLDGRLARRVHVAGGLVEHEDRCVLQQRAAMAIRCPLDKDTPRSLTIVI